MNILTANKMYLFQYLARSLSVPGRQESDLGYTSYAGSCSVHGTLKRHISSGVDTTFEDDVFDDFSQGNDIKKNGNGTVGFPIHTGWAGHQYESMFTIFTT